MDNGKSVVAIIGTYRKGGVVDTLVDEVLDSAREAGARVSRIYLSDRQVAFCSNCRECMQQEGSRRGGCSLADDIPAILDEIERSDAIVLASPVNFGTVTAVMKRFIERLACLAYWPWGVPGPKLRRRHIQKRAVVIASSAAPAVVARFGTRIVSLLKTTAGLLGAKTIGVVFVGMAAREPGQGITLRAGKKARALGKKLVG